MTEIGNINKVGNSLFHTFNDISYQIGYNLAGFIKCIEFDEFVVYFVIYTI